MNWEDESYVRLYKRDTITWKLIGWQGRCVLPLLLRKVDRAGCAELEGAGMEGIAALIDVPIEVVEPGVKAMILRGVVELRGDILVFPKYMAAHEARQSDRLRQKESRARRREVTMTSSYDVTENFNRSHGVTNRDDDREIVTMRSDEIRSEEKRKDESPTGINTPARTQAASPKEQDRAQRHPASNPHREPSPGAEPAAAPHQSREAPDPDRGSQGGRAGADAGQPDQPLGDCRVRTGGHSPPAGRVGSGHGPGVSEIVAAKTEPLTLLTVWPLLVERIPWLKPDREYPATRERMKGEVTTGLPGMLHNSLVTEFGRTQRANPPVTLADFGILCEWAMSPAMDFMAPADRQAHLCKHLTLAVGKALDWDRRGRPAERAPPKSGFVPQPGRSGNNILARLTKRKP